MVGSGLVVSCREVVVCLMCTSVVQLFVGGVVWSGVSGFDIKTAPTSIELFWGMVRAMAIHHFSYVSDGKYIGPPQAEIPVKRKTIQSLSGISTLIREHS